MTVEPSLPLLNPSQTLLYLFSCMYMYSSEVQALRKFIIAVLTCKLRQYPSDSERWSPSRARCRPLLRLPACYAQRAPATRYDDPTHSKLCLIHFLYTFRH